MLGIGIGLPLTPLAGMMSRAYGTRPTLDLNFMGGGFDSRITFSRADAVTCATYFDSTGRLQRMGRNILTYSSTFTNAAWTKTDVTPTLGESSPLDVGYLMTEGSAGTAGTFQSGAAVTAGSTITASVVVKRGNNDFFYMFAQETTGVDGAACTFNINTGAIGTPTAFGAATSPTATITNLGGGWYRCTVSCVPNGTYTVPRITFRACTSLVSTTRVSGATYTVSAAQLETGSTATTYSATTTAANSGPRFDYDPATPVDSGARGPELVTNGDFSQGATGWAFTQPTSGSVSVTNGALRLNSADGSLCYAQQNPALVTGRNYVVSFDVVAASAGSVGFTIDGSTIIKSASSVGTFTQQFIFNGTAVQFKRVSGVTDVTIDNISVKEVIPATTGPELVTNGDFSQGFTGWSAIAGGWSIADGVATLTGNGAPQDLQQNVVTATGKTYLLSYNVISSTGTMLLTADGNTVASGSSGTISGYYRATGTSITLVAKRQSGTVNAVIDNVSVKEVTFTPRGLLIEESRQNLLLQSRDMTQAAWTKTDVTPARTQVGIDGVANTACLMTEGSAGTAVTAQNGAAVTAGSTITGSVVLKRGNTDWVRITFGESTLVDGVRAWFNLNTGAKGAATAYGAGASISSSITSLGGGWYRCSVTCLPNGTYTVPYIAVCSASADSSTTRVSGATYIVDCAQLEVGAFATSIIPTTTTALTRAADVATISGANFSSWWNATQGSFVAELRRFGFDNGAGAVGICQADDGTTNNRVALRLGVRASTAPAQQTIVVAGTVSLNESLGLTTSIDGLTVKATIGYQVGVGATGRDGTIVNATSNPSLPTVTQLNMGQGPGAVALNGWLRSLRYYPTRLANATLQALTA